MYDAVGRPSGATDDWYERVAAAVFEAVAEVDPFNLSWIEPRGSEYSIEVGHIAELIVEAGHPSPDDLEQLVSLVFEKWLSRMKGDDARNIAWRVTFDLWGGP